MAFASALESHSNDNSVSTGALAAFRIALGDIERSCLNDQNVELQPVPTIG